MTDVAWTVWIDGKARSGPALCLAFADDIGDWRARGTLLENEKDAKEFCDYLRRHGLNARVTRAKIVEEPS